VRWLCRWWKKEPDPVRLPFFPSFYLDQLEEQLGDEELLVLSAEERRELRRLIIDLERITGTSFALHDWHIRNT
jgi:hypothetical protein